MNNFVQAINALHNVIWGVFLTLVFLLFFTARLRNQPVLGPLVDSLNRVGITVWMVAILAAGVVLTCCGQREQGSNLIVGAFAVLRSDPDKQHASPESAKVPNA
jgi:hypothetical protein